MKVFQTSNSKILELRNRMFANCDNLPDQELIKISEKYHAIVFRYQVFVENIKRGEIKN